MRDNMLAFTRLYCTGTDEDWEKFMLSYESTFRLIRNPDKKVRRPTGSYLFDERFTIKTVKQPESLMVWGSFSGAVERRSDFFLP